MTGHLLGAAGGWRRASPRSPSAIRSCRRRSTTRRRSGSDLDIIPNEARRVKLDYALSNSFGFGGTNGALVFKRYAG